MTPEQERESRNFKYETSYKRWLGVAKKLGYSTVTEMLRDLYQKRSTYGVSTLTGFNQQSVVNCMVRMGIKRRKRGF